jgi:porin
MSHSRRLALMLATTLTTAGVAGGALAQPAPGRTQDPGIATDIGEQLDAMGIRLRAQLVNEMAANPTGGVKQGNTDTGQAQLGFSVDMSKVAHIPGGTFHFNYIRSYGDSLAKNFDGSFYKSQEVYKNNFHPFRLAIFAWEQKAFDDKLDILVGRMGSTGLYGRLSNTCFFQSGITCGEPQVLNSEAGLTFNTSSTWAGNFKYHFTDNIALMAGAFEVNSFLQHTNGWDWSSAKATGVTIPMELQIGDYDISKYRYPFDFKVGGYVSTAPTLNPFYNTKGQSLGLLGGTAMTDTSERRGVYGMGEKVIWRPNPTQEKNLAVFGGFLQTLDHNDEIADWQAFGGAVARDVVPGRPHDIISVTASNMGLSGNELAFLRDSRLKAGGHGVNGRNEIGLEADYSYLLFNSARVAPNVTYIINPDNSQIPKTKVLPDNILTFGVKITFNLATWAGLPVAPNISD